MNKNITDDIFNKIDEATFQENRLSVTEKDYREAIDLLYKVALNNTGQSEVVAKVLLSAYDGYKYQISIPDLSSLDLALFEMALIIIRGRAINKIEPHEIIENGQEKFKNLVALYGEK